MLEKFFGKKEPVKRVLIVEDDAMLSRVLAESLKAEKFKIEIVSDGSLVMDEVIKFQPHIILLDLILPGIDGFEVLKQLKEETKTTNIPVVVLSNLDQASDVKSVKALGAQQYFLKATTDTEVIVDYVKNLLKK
jgi:Response regulators consisting of a CheY-like receiver domain and a winged-helix DNA-binding domain